MNNAGTVLGLIGLEIGLETDGASGVLKHTASI